MKSALRFGCACVHDEPARTVRVFERLLEFWPGIENLPRKKSPIWWRALAVQAWMFNSRGTADLEPRLRDEILDLKAGFIINLRIDGHLRIGLQLKMNNSGPLDACVRRIVALVSCRTRAP